MLIDLGADNFAPPLPDYGRHIFICTHGNCASGSATAALLQRLQELNEEHDRVRFSNHERVIATASGCLGVCMGGPVLVIYPEGIWYANVDVAKLERIYREHLLGGAPVAEYILHRHYPAGQEAIYAPALRPPQGVDPFLLLAEQAAAEKAAQRRNPTPEEGVSDRVRAARERRRNRENG